MRLSGGGQDTVGSAGGAAAQLVDEALNDVLALAVHRFEARGALLRADIGTGAWSKLSDGCRVASEEPPAPLVDRVHRARELEFIADATQDEVLKDSRLVHEHGFLSFVSAPLTVAGRSAGVFCLLDSRFTRGVDDEGRRQLGEFCRMIETRLELAQRLAEPSVQGATQRSAHGEAGRESNGPLDELERLVRQRTADLEAVNKELEAFSYSVSHDLRAPIRSISGFSEALLQHHAKSLNAEAAHYLRRIQANAKQMNLLIEDLLQLSRLSRQDMQRSEVDLTELAHKAVDEVKERYPGQPVRCRVAAGLRATGDERLLSIVLTNLLDNAWKFSRDRSPAEVEVGGEHRGADKVFFVRDNGVGFEMNRADKLFRPFGRLHRPGEFEGTGIGLATVQRIVRRHGGTVWAEAQVDKGATVYVALP